MKVSEFKKILPPGKQAFFLLNDGRTVNIDVNMGNIIRVAGRVRSWASFVQMVSGWGLSRLYFRDSKGYLNFENGEVVSSGGWGGRRVPGAGKKLGRPVSKKVKKKTCSFALTPATIEKISSGAAASGVSKSEYLERILNNEQAKSGKRKDAGGL